MTKPANLILIKWSYAKSNQSLLCEEKKSFGLKLSSECTSRA